MLVAAGAVIILNNIVGRYWRRYYTKQHSSSLLGPLLFSTMMLVAAGAVIILNNIVGRYWSRNYT